ncbi:MAG: dehydrogenase E1 component subunit alpha/beta [Deltaproteobacteria bacterium]|nr:dehydrogenase E1 component subunit alpha/beta [Deltaproteobacteria bacterium]
MARSKATKSSKSEKVTKTSRGESPASDVSISSDSSAGPSVAWLRRAHFLARLSRAWDLRFEAMARTGRIGRWYSAVGNEMTTVGAALMMAPLDALSTVHRDLGSVLATYLDVTRAAPELFDASERTAWDAMREDPHEVLYRLVCQLLGRRDGFTQGVDRSFHYGLLDDSRGIRHVGMISHLGAMLPVGAGLAMAARQDQARGVVLGFVGEGATSQGDFHETLNTAGVLALPYVLVIENNQFAFSTPVSEQYACRFLADRAVGYGIAGETIDGTDLFAVYDALSRAFSRAREGRGASLIEAVLPRMRGHAEGDGSYELIPEELRAAFLAQDPLPKLEQALLAQGVMDQARMDAVQTAVVALVERALERALACVEPDLSEAQRSMYAPGDAADVARTQHSDHAGKSQRNALWKPDWTPSPSGTETTYIDALRRAMSEEMALHDGVMLLGQDVAEFGGAFRGSKGLFEQYGRLRVCNTPLQESATMGMALGLALRGRRPIVELQFADFVSCGFNQIVNNLAKNYYRWKGAVPTVIRLPYGGGVGAGPFHSQSPEAWFAHTPGLVVVAPSTAADAYGLMKSAIRDDNPVIFLEHRFLYRREKDVLPEGHDYTVPIGKARVLREGTAAAVTVLTWGWCVGEALAAAEELAGEGVSVEVVDLRTLVPLDEETVFASVRKTGKVLVLHEATRTAGFGAELAARVSEHCFEQLDGPVRRLTYADRAAPYNKKLEATLLPDRAKVTAAIRKLAQY